MTPSDQIDALAEAYYERLHEGDRSRPWERQSAPRQEKHRRAVRALLLRQVEIEEASMDGHVVFIPPAGPVTDAVARSTRAKHRQKAGLVRPGLPVSDRLTRRAG